MRVNAVIVAAGKGSRVGGGESKVLLPVAGQPLLLHALHRFRRSREVCKAVVVAPRADLERYEDLIRTAPLEPLETVVRPGGTRRQDSVRAGLDALDRDCEFVVVHDGARPFPAPDLIDRCARESCRNRSVTAAVPVRNTIKTVARGRVKQTLPRSELWEVQTPQAFPVGLLRDAHARAAAEGVTATDDAMLVERLGAPVRVVEGSAMNLKVTYPEDLLFAEVLAARGLA